MQELARAVLLALLVVLAGCSGVVQETEPTTTETVTAGSDTVAETTASATEAGTTTVTATTAEIPQTTESPRTTESAPDNPWSEEEVTVAVVNRANRSRNVTPLVNRTLAYWNEHADEHGDYDVTFALSENDRSADVVVEYVVSIPECGVSDNETTVGCAPLLTAHSTASGEETVEVVAGYSNDSTVEILKHEFGHLLGIEHGEEPMPTMEALSRHTYLSQSDASERELPWRNATLTVAVDMENMTYRQTAREQVRHALEYYEDGADGAVPENVSFVTVDDASEADIAVSSPTAVTCGQSRDTEASCGRTWGYDTDTDDALEYYSRAEITVAHQAEVDLVGWYVGYWLGYAFGLDEDELPEPFVDADYETASGEWWE